MAWRYRIVARVDRPIFLQRKRDTMVGCLSNLPLVLINEVYSLSVNKIYIQLVPFIRIMPTCSKKIVVLKARISSLEPGLVIIESPKK